MSIGRRGIAPGNRARRGVLTVLALALASCLPADRSTAHRDPRPDAPTGFPAPETFSPALWDSVTALRRALGAAAGHTDGGACLRDEQEIEFYIQNQRFWTEHRLARTVAIEDPTRWSDAELGPDVLLPAEAQLLRAAAMVLGPTGSVRPLETEFRRLEPAEEQPCRGGLKRMRLLLPPLLPHSLLRWEISWREPSATVRATHWFGGAHAVLESRFSFVFPRAYLDTDWGQFVRAAGSIPVPEVQDEVGPLNGDRRFTYRARLVAPIPGSPFSAPLADRVPHLLLLPERGGPESRQELRILCNRLEGAAVLDAAARESILDSALARAVAPAERARILRETVMSRVRLSPLPLHVQEGVVRDAADTWRAGCGTAADIAALLVAGLRELNLPARPLLARSRGAGPADTTTSDPSEFDRVLVEVGSAEPAAGSAASAGVTFLDASCPLCPWGYLRADLQGLLAVGMDRGALRWRPLPTFPPGTNWMRRTVVMTPAVESAPEAHPGDGRQDDDGPPPFVVHIERTAFGEPALRVREAEGMEAPGGEVLPPEAHAPGVREGSAIFGRAPDPTRLPSALLHESRRRSPLAGIPELDRPVTVRDTMRVEAERGADGWRLPESILGHRGVLPGLETSPDSSSLVDPVVLPHTLVLADSTVIVLPPGWTAFSLPEPTMVQGAGFHFVTNARLEEGRAVLTGLLAIEVTRFPGARARDLAQLAASIRAKDRRTVILRRR